MRTQIVYSHLTISILLLSAIRRVCSNRISNLNEHARQGHVSEYFMSDFEKANMKYQAINDNNKKSAHNI